MNKKYELTLILKALLPEDIRNAAQSKIESFIKSKDGVILNTDVWGKKHLAYKIKKHDEGYYIVYSLELDPASANELKAYIQIMSEVLRSLLLRGDQL